MEKETAFPVLSKNSDNPQANLSKSSEQKQFVQECRETQKTDKKNEKEIPSKIITEDVVNSIYRICDEKIDWFEILSSSKPIYELFSEELWGYLHSVAYKICIADIDAYFDVINNINPFDDMLDFCDNFKFGIDEDDSLAVSFSIKGNLYFANDDLKESFIAACIIRIARDTFSLLPADKIIINYIDNSNLKTYVIEEKSIKKVRFRFSDPKAILNKIFKKL